MKKTRTKKETTEQTLERWIAGSAKYALSYDELIDAGWEAGQVGYITVDGVNYERFHLADGRYVVIEWDSEGNICVL